VKKSILESSSPLLHPKKFSPLCHSDAATPRMDTLPKYGLALLTFLCQPLLKTKSEFRISKLGTGLKSSKTYKRCHPELGSGSDEVLK
jgi:hypothetical protein